MVDYHDFVKRGLVSLLTFLIFSEIVASCGCLLCCWLEFREETTVITEISISLHCCPFFCIPFYLIFHEKIYVNAGKTISYYNG